MLGERETGRRGGVDVIPGNVLGLSHAVAALIESGNETWFMIEPVYLRQGDVTFLTVDPGGSKTRLVRWNVGSCRGAFKNLI